MFTFTHMDLRDFTDLARRGPAAWGLDTEFDLHPVDAFAAIDDAGEGDGRVLLIDFCDWALTLPAKATGNAGNAPTAAAHSSPFRLMRNKSSAGAAAGAAAGGRAGGGNAGGSRKEQLAAMLARTAEFEYKQKLHLQ
jgi:hypothetical protein